MCPFQGHRAVLFFRMNYAIIILVCSCQVAICSLRRTKMWKGISYAFQMLFTFEIWKEHKNTVGMSIRSISNTSYHNARCPFFAKNTNTHTWHTKSVHIWLIFSVRPLTKCAAYARECARDFLIGCGAHAHFDHTKSATMMVVVVGFFVVFFF